MGYHIYGGSSRYGHANWPDNALHAGQFCHLDTLMWLVDERSVLPTRLPVRNPSSEEDLLAVYNWMQMEGFQGWSNDDQRCAARNGYLRAIQWLLEHKPEFLTSLTMDAAADNDHLHIVKWLHEHSTEGCTVRAFSRAAENGHLNVVQWLSKHRNEGETNEAMVRAAMGGRVDVLAWLYANRSDSCGSCVLFRLLRDDESVENARNAIQWLGSHNTRAGTCVGTCVSDPLQDTFMSVPATALCNGDLKFARVMHHIRPSEFTVHPLQFVVRSGHLPILQWLLDTIPERVDWPLALQTAREARQDSIVAWLEIVIPRMRTELI